MNLAVLCFCVLQVATVNGGLFTGDDFKMSHDYSASKAARDGGQRATEPVNHGRVRTLFARRFNGRQRNYEPKSKVVPVPSQRPLPEAALKPADLKCSMLSESCMPNSLCCDPCATCHCRFFNAICFCRKMSLHCGKKT